MAKVPAKEPSLNDALQGDLFANALTDTTTKDLSDIPSDGDNAKANTQLKTKAKAKAKASAKDKSTASAPVHSQSQDKSQATGNSHNKAQAKIEAKADTKADSKSKAKNKADAKGESKGKGKAKADSKAKAKTKSKNKDDAKGEAKAKAKLMAKHQSQSLASGKDDGKSNEVLLDPSLELINNSAQSSNATATTNATAPALTKVKANKHAHHANKSQDKELVLGSNSNELSNSVNMGLLTDTEQTLLSPLFSDVLSEQNILEESKDSLLTPHMSSLLEGQELEGQALESELKIVSCTEVNSAASESASSSTSANTSDSDSTSASSSESAQSQSDASNSDTSHSDTKGKSNESVKIELGLGALGSLGSLGANLTDGGEFELKVQTVQELEALDKVSGQDKADTEDNNAKQGSLFLEGYVVGQGGLFDDVNDEVVNNNNNDDIELVYVPLKEVSLQEKFSDVLAPSENLPELGEDESDSDVDIYAPQEPAFNFFEPSPDSLQASQFPSLSAEASTHTSAGGSASASTGANAEVKAMGEGEAVIINHEVESDSTMATKSQDDTKVKATATRKARAGAKSRVKADSNDGTGAGADLVTQVGADAGAGADAEAGAGAGAGAKTSAKAKAKAKVVYEPYEYPIDPKVYAVCGIDEAGRGPLMGDVVAACVILDHNHMIEGLNDSKKLTEKARDALAPIIKEQAIAYGIGRASPQEIDSLNILNATFLAMRRAFDAMQKSCNLALIDGNKIPKTFSDIPMVMEAVVKGDARVAEISAASILAKTTRDADCYELDKLYPEYGFARHKGYPTKDHLEALAKLPILPCYRKSYGPVKKLLAGSQDEVGAISPNVQKRLETAKDTKQKKLDELLTENTLISLDDFA